MIQISIFSVQLLITFLWVLLRCLACIRKGYISWKREAQLFLVYVALQVVIRFTFFPFSKIDGQIQPLPFDPVQAFPFRINLLPFVYLFDYPTSREALINLIGNTAMFVPIGILWPAIFRELNTHTRAITVGIGFSLCIELLQLPFHTRVSDIDDLILNSLGYLLGYAIYWLYRWIRRKRAAR
ncbi:MAG: VanZ family protein [Oscillospiraceae bacterium]|nr:VanZ family protein [Oscillospiraceae bacterium]